MARLCSRLARLLLGVALIGLAPTPSFASDASGAGRGGVRNLQLVFSERAKDWNDTIGDSALVEETLVQLRAVLVVARRLLQAPCKGGQSNCARRAPELLCCSETAQFLTSTLDAYSDGLRQEDVVGWAAAATAFFDGHRRRLRDRRTTVAAGCNEPSAAAGEADATAASAGSGGNANGRALRLGGRRALRSDDSDDSGEGEPSTTAADPEDIRSQEDSDDDVSDEDSEQERHRQHREFYDKEPPLSPNNTVTGLPVVRRVLLAQLLIGWLTTMKRQLPTAPKAQAMLSQLMRELYAIHVESVEQRRIQEFLHISKTGGTSWTQAASKSGCMMPRTNAARVRYFNDECRWMPMEPLMAELNLTAAEARNLPTCPRYGTVDRRTVAPTCERRYEYATSRNYTYISNEYTLHGGLFNMNETHICPQFVNVLSIREPVSRLRSNLKYIMIKLHSDLRSASNSSKKAFKKLFCNSDASFWRKWAPPVVDNYSIRTFVGEHAFHAPLGTIGEQHLELANALMLQFDLVHRVDASDTAADMLMRTGLGWRATLAEVHVWSSERLAGKAGLDFATCPLGDTTPLDAAQTFDERWYRFGRVLNMLDVLFLAAVRKHDLRPWEPEIPTFIMKNSTVAVPKTKCGFGNFAKRRQLIRSRLQKGGDD